MQNTTATRIVILTDTNWKAYKASIYAAALQSGNMDLLRKSTKPTDAASLPDWNLKNDKINGFILGSISVSHHHLFSINEDCYNNFRNLEKWHHDNRAVNQEIYLKRLKDELQKNSDILTHLNNWMIRLEDYKGVDGKLEELQQCRILLASLNPVQWNSFSMTIETSDKITQTDGTEVDNKLKLNYLVNRIKEVAATLNLSKPQSDSANITITTKNKSNQSKNSNQSSSNSTRKWNPDLTCFNCGGRSHNVKECSSPKNPKPYEFRPEGFVYKSNPKANVTKVNMSNDKPVDNGWLTGEGAEKDMIYLDNCCSRPIFNDLQWFSYINYDIHGGTLDTIFSSNSGSIAGVGPITITINDYTLHIPEALYVPTAGHNLLSQGTLKKAGFTFTDLGLDTKIIDPDGNFVGLARVSQNNMAIMVDAKPPLPLEVNFNETKAPISKELAHKRFCHISASRLNELNTKQMVKNLEITDPYTDISSCDVCKVAKSKRLPHKARANPTKYAPGELVVADYKGPLETRSIGGGDRGFVVYKDIGSRFAKVYPVSTKSDQASKFMEFKPWLENMTGKKIKFFRHDRGGEFMDNNFQKELLSYGIEDQTTPAGSPEGNSFAESHIRILMMMVKSTFIQGYIPKGFWSEMVISCNYIYNRTPTASLDGCTPYEMIYGKKPRVDHLRILGCKAIVHIRKENRLALDVPGKICKLIGYSQNSPTYRLFDGHKIIESRDVDFDENSFQFSYSNIQSKDEGDQSYFIPLDYSEPTPEINPSVAIEEPTPVSPTIENTTSNLEIQTFWDRPSNRKNPVDRAHYTSTDPSIVPSNYRQAMASPDKGERKY